MLLPCCTCGDLVNADDGVAPILAKASQLMAEAGYPNGFNVDWVTPAPPFYSRGERVIAQQEAIGIRTRLQNLERAVCRDAESRCCLCRAADRHRLGAAMSAEWFQVGDRRDSRVAMLLQQERAGVEIEVPEVELKAPVERDGKV
jgi:hypothetical protein